MSFARIPPMAYYEIMVTPKEIPPRTARTQAKQTFLAGALR